MNDANKILLNHRIEEELETVTESDAVEFLTENGHDVNAAIIASLTDNTNLPDEEDYLLNEKLLKNYFDN